MATRLAELINDLRSRNGLVVLEVHPVLEAKASSWASTMALQRRIWHSVVPDGITIQWSRLGENVGMAPSVDEIHQAFVTSPLHYANLVHPDYRYVGLGVSVVEDTLFVAQEFMALQVPATPIPTAPVPATQLLAVPIPTALVPAPVEPVPATLPEASPSSLSVSAEALPGARGTEAELPVSSTTASTFDSPVLPDDIAARPIVAIVSRSPDTSQVLLWVAMGLLALAGARAALGRLSRSSTSGAPNRD
ncbi:MAG: CAP domain-containing protein [Acidimicrobiia bacterium]